MNNLKDLSTEQLTEDVLNWEPWYVENRTVAQCCGNCLPSGECCTAMYGTDRLVQGCEQEQVQNEPLDWQEYAVELSKRLKDSPLLTSGWVSVEGFKANSGTRVLTYSPFYPEGDPMRYRLVDAQFVRAMKEVTHCYIPEPPPPQGQSQEVKL